MKQTLYDGKLEIEADRFNNFTIVKNELPGGKVGPVQSNLAALVKMLDKPSLRQHFANQAVDYLHERWLSRRDPGNNSPVLSEFDFKQAKEWPTKALKESGGNDFLNGLGQVIEMSLDPEPIAISAQAAARGYISQNEERALAAFDSWVKVGGVQFLSVGRIVYTPDIDLAGRIDVQYSKAAHPGKIYNALIRTVDLEQFASKLFIEWIIELSAATWLEDAEAKYIKLNIDSANVSTETYNPIPRNLSILRLDRINGRFDEAPVEGNYWDHAVNAVMLRYVYVSELYQKELADRKAWKR